MGRVGNGHIELTTEEEDSDAIVFETSESPCHRLDCLDFAVEPLAHGNGHPVAGVVTSRKVMEAFRETFRYFNTFGGNPVSMAAAQAVLEVIREEGLQENARAVGDYARQGLRALADKHAVIGDVRGSGLFFGAELVLDRDAKTPATDYTKAVANALRHKGVLMNFLGIHYNVLKIRPPMVFSKDDADRMLAAVDEALGEVPVG